MGLLDRLPFRRRQHREEVEAAHNAAITEQRERAADKEIRHAYTIAHKLAAHRGKDRFADRVRAAYGRQGGHA